MTPMFKCTKNYLVLCYAKNNKCYLKVYYKDTEKEYEITGTDGVDREFNKLSISTDKSSNKVYLVYGSQRITNWNTLWVKEIIINQDNIQVNNITSFTAPKNYHFAIPNIFHKTVEGKTDIYIIYQLPIDKGNDYSLIMVKIDNTGKQAITNIENPHSKDEFRDNTIFENLLSYKASYQKGILYDVLTGNKIFIDIKDSDGIVTNSYGNSFVKDGNIFHIYAGIWKNIKQYLYLWDSINKKSQLIDNDLNSGDYDDLAQIYLDNDNNIYLAYTYSNGSSLIVKKVIGDKQEILFTQKAHIPNHSYCSIYGYNNQLYIAWEREQNNLVVETIKNINTDKVIDLTAPEVETPVETPVENPDGKIEGKIDAKIQKDIVSEIKKTLIQKLINWISKLFGGK